MKEVNLEEVLIGLFESYEEIPEEVIQEVKNFIAYVPNSGT